MASGGSSGRNSSGPRSFDFGSDDVLCAYDDFGNNQDPANGRRPDLSAKDLHESRMGRPLVSVYGQQDEYPKEILIDAVEKCMKKYADNLLRHLEGISGRLSQLEIYCYKLERSVGEFRADMIRDQGDTDTKLKSLEKHLQEVHRSIQILRDKQELADTQKELTKLQLAPKDSSTQSQKSEEASAPASVPEPERHDDAMEAPNLHLALALTHHNQVPMQQLPPSLPHQAAPSSLGAPHDRYVPVQYYPHQSQALQPEMHYIQQPRPQIQDSTQVTPPPQQQQQPPPPPPQAFPQYQQQWPQPVVSQQFTQQVVAPTQQPAPQGQLTRPCTPPTYLPYSHQPTNPEAFAYAAVPQSGGSRPDTVPYSYGGSGGTQPQQQPSSGGSFASPYPRPQPQSNMQGYNAVYNIDGNRVQAYQHPPPPSSIQGTQNQQVAHGGSGGGFHHPGAQLMRPHPYSDMIEKAASMGFPRDQVVGVVNRMAAESGQAVDFNALLDRLNSRPTTAGPPRAWSG